MKRMLLCLIILIIAGCENSVSSDQNTENSSWVFVANEGSFFGSNGTISMIDNFGNVDETDALGDVVQALEVYNNQLIVSVNNSYKVVLFDIDSQGLSNHTEVLIDGGPREIEIVGNKAYITVWDADYNVYPVVPGHVNILNLDNLEIEQSIEVGIMPEGLHLDGNYLWVANSGESSVSKIDISTNSVVETIEVGNGPQNLISHNNDIYVSRTFYEYDGVDENGYWINPRTIHGSSKIGSEIIINNYGSGVVCGGSVLSYDSDVYRSFDGGIFPLEENLDINNSGRIGDYNQDKVYHVEVINDNIWFGLRDLGGESGEVKVVDSNGFELESFSVGINPGDFAIWNQ